MKCPRCQVENQSDAQYCGACGYPFFASADEPPSDPDVPEQVQTSNAQTRGSFLRKLGSALLLPLLVEALLVFLGTCVVGFASSPGSLLGRLGFSGFMLLTVQTVAMPTLVAAAIITGVLWRWPRITLGKLSGVAFLVFLAVVPAGSILLWASLDTDCIPYGRFFMEKYNSDGQLLAKWGSCGREDGQFMWPEGIAVDRQGNIYIADSSNHRLQKLSSNGKFLAKYGSFGNVIGVAVDGAGVVFVADRLSGSVQKFSSGGEFLGKWGTKGSADGQFSFLVGVAVDAMGNVYVADDRVQKFSSGGEFLGKWGTPGKVAGQFSVLSGVAVDGVGNVFVADSGNHRVQKFNSNGKFLAKWGTQGSGEGQFSYPTDLAVDGAGNVFVADSSGRRVQKFDSNGQFLNKWSAEGVISGLAADGSGNVYLVEQKNLE